MRISLVCLAVLGLLAATLLLRCRKEPPPPDPRAAAESCLALLRAAVTAENCQRMGFDSLAQVAATELGDPFRVVSVDTVRWRIDPYDPAKELPEYRYPVKVGAQERLVIAVRRVGNYWKATGFGGANYLQALLAAEGGTTGSRDSTFVVRVPGLGECFLARPGVDGLWLKSLYRNPGLQVMECEVVRADSALTWIRQYYGSMRSKHREGGAID